MRRVKPAQDSPLQDHTRVDSICRYLLANYRQARQANFDPERAADYALYKAHRMGEYELFWLSSHPDSRRQVNGAYRTLV